MPTEAEVTAAMKSALESQPRDVPYPDYETTEDFPLWLSGYAAKIRNAFGYGLDEDDEVKAEVVRSIGGRMSVGRALETYNGLPNTVKENYAQMVAKLTEEFVDPNEQRKFNDNMAYNKRQSGQSLEDFMYVIKKDMNRYSTLPPKVAVNGVEVDNPEKEKEEVKRFKVGMRTIKGKKDKELKRFLRSRLLLGSDLTWDNALELATRWENAYSENESVQSVGSDAEDGDAVAALSDQINDNQQRITNLEIAQEHMGVEIEGLKASQEVMGNTVDRIAAKLDHLFPPQYDLQPHFHYGEEGSHDGGATAW